MQRLPAYYFLAACVCILACVGFTAADVDHCDDPVEAYYVADGRDYRGRVNTTVDGIACQPWTSQVPHAHDTNVAPGSSVGDHNYCRNVNELSGPGCFTMDPKVRYQLCRVGPPCPLPPERPSIIFDPPSGTHFQLADAGTVTVACFPKPCELFYTLDGSQPSIETSARYQGPLTVVRNATIKVIGRFVKDQTLNRVAAYTVAPRDDGATSPYYFSPADDVAYTDPVLVVLRGVRAGDDVVLFLNDAVTGVPYTQPFWINETSTVVAVVNGKVGARARYTVTAVPAPIAVYPDSGQYVGGVSALVWVDEAKEGATIRRSINGSAWEELTSMRFTIDTPGLTEIRVSATYLGGTVAMATAMYDVIAAAPPKIQPSNQGTYTHPINVSCTDPLGRLLSFGKDEEDEDIFYMYFDRPGAYALSCSYQDDLHLQRATTEEMHLSSKPLPPPTFYPPCGSTYPSTPLSLRIAITAPYLGEKNVSRLSLVAEAAGGDLQFLIRDSPDGAGYGYAIRPTHPSTVEVSAYTQSTNPLEADSPMSVCTYHVQPIGSVSTPLFSMRPTCSDAEGPASRAVSAACATSVAMQLSACLNFYTTDLIAVRRLGPFLVTAVTGLQPDMKDDMYRRVGDCLAEGGVANNIVNETSGALELAVSWRLADTPAATGRPNEVPAGQSFLVEVKGYNAHRGAYRLVRDEYPCSDIGIPSLNLLRSARARGWTEDDNNESEQTDALFETSKASAIIFLVKAPGLYKLCAAFDSDMYEVPPSSRATKLRVVPAPALHLAASAASPCGGVVRREHNSIPILVSFQSTSPQLRWQLYHSINAGPWRSQEASQPITLGAMGSSEKQTEVVTASLGAASGEAETCVFYAPAANPPIDAKGIRYAFYEAGHKQRRCPALLHTEDTATEAAPSRPAAHGLTDVVMTLQGNFQRSERIVVELYENVSTTAAPREWWLNESFIAKELRFVSHTLSTSTDGAAQRLALPDAVLRLPYGPDNKALLVRALLDGEPAEVTPIEVEVSSLAIAMVPCTRCASGYCYDDSCVCIGTVNRTAYLCGTKDGGGGEEVPTTPLGERFGLLILYFGLLAGIGAAFFVAIKRGTKQQQEGGAGTGTARDVVIVDIPQAPQATPQEAPIAPREGVAPSPGDGNPLENDDPPA